MKRTLTILLALLFTLALSDGARAQNSSSKPAHQPRTSTATSPSKRPDRDLLSRILNELDLNDQQRQQVKDVFEAHRQAVDTWVKEHGKELRELTAKLREALRSNQVEVVKSLRKEIGKLETSRKQMQNSLMQKLSEVLNKQQMEKVRQLLPRPIQGGDIFRQMQRLNPTQEQKKAIQDILKGLRDTARGDARREAMRAVHKKILDEVLTPEQKKQLQDMRRNTWPNDREHPLRRPGTSSAPASQPSTRFAP